METNYNIKNFRAFDENGIELTFEPITILTGCNSSGKSSVVKSVFLLDSFLSEIKKAHEENEPISLNDYKLDFNSYPNNLLGRFDKVLNRSSKDHTITFEYTVYSLMLSEDVTVQLVFSADDNDQLNNGYLDSVKIFNEDGVIFSSKDGERNRYNLEIIKDQIIDFIVGEHAIHNYCGLRSSYEFDGNISEEEFTSQQECHFKGFREIGGNRIIDIAKNVRKSSNNRSLAEQFGCKNESLDWSYNKKSLFYIPLVEKISSSTKDCITSNIDALIPNISDEFLRISVQKIIDDFKESECLDFGEYFHKKEFEFLSDIHVIDRNSSFLFQEEPSVVKIPDKSDFEICQSLLFNLQTVTLCRFDKGFDAVHCSDADKANEKEDNVATLQNLPVTFSFLYEIIMSLNKLYDHSESDYYAFSENFIGAEKYHHFMYDASVRFLQELILEVLIPEWVGSFSYVSSSRINVKRLYPLEMNDDFTNLLKKYFEAKRLFLNKEKNELKLVSLTEYKPDDFMNKWASLFGIGKIISISVDDEGLGAQIRLQKSESDTGNLLADEGYGITQLFSILLQIETSILSGKEPRSNNYFGLSSIDNYDNVSHPCMMQTIAIEEPEIHLHPKYQSLLADMFNEAYQKYNIHFIIETHSEYLIRKEQVLVAETDSEYHVDNDKISIVYVNDGSNEDEPRAKYIGICKDGYLNDSFGEGFFDEATVLTRRLL